MQIWHLAVRAGWHTCKEKYGELGCMVRLVRPDPWGEAAVKQFEISDPDAWTPLYLAAENGLGRAIAP